MHIDGMSLYILNIQFICMYMHIQHTLRIVGKDKLGDRTWFAKCRAACAYFEGLRFPTPAHVPVYTLSRCARVTRCVFGGELYNGLCLCLAQLVYLT